MKIDGVRKVAAIFKAIAPEYKEMEEEEFKIWVELAEPYVSEKKFGKFYHQALAYLAAHKLSLNAPVKKQGEESRISTSVKDTMNVASFSEGSTSISFNNPSTSSSGGSSSADAEYLLTSYGLQFLDICKRCIVPIAISGMKRT